MAYLPVFAMFSRNFVGRSHPRFLASAIVKRSISGRAAKAAYTKWTLLLACADCVGEAARSRTRATRRLSSSAGHGRVGTDGETGGNSPKSPHSVPPNFFITFFKYAPSQTCTTILCENISTVHHRKPRQSPETNAFSASNFFVLF
jgi:hypothetical protein